MHDWIFSLADDFLLCDSNLLKRMSCPSEFICFPLPVAMAMPKTENNKFARFLLHNCATKHKSRPRTFRDLLNGVVWISSGRFGCALEFLGKEGDKSAMGRIERWDKKRNIFLYSILGSLCLDCRDLLQNYVVEMEKNFEFLKQSCQEIWILWKLSILSQPDQHSWWLHLQTNLWYFSRLLSLHSLWSHFPPTRTTTALRKTLLLFLILRSRH